MKATVPYCSHLTKAIYPMEHTDRTYQNTNNHRMKIASKWWRDHRLIFLLSALQLNNTTWQPCRLGPGNRERPLGSSVTAVDKHQGGGKTASMEQIRRAAEKPELEKGFLKVEKRTRWWRIVSSARHRVRRGAHDHCRLQGQWPTHKWTFIDKMQCWVACKFFTR